MDTSSCPLSPRPSAFTFGMTGATITAVGGHPRTYDLRRAGVAANLEGEGALFVLNEPSYAHFSGVLGLELPDLSALPANLRITREKLKKYFVSFGDGGGTIAITGKVTRPKTDPSRPCAFLPEYYRVIGSTSAGNWLSVQPESGCSPGKPDSGTLVIGALPARSGQPHVGAIFTAWGAVVFVVENGG